MMCWHSPHASRRRGRGRVWGTRISLPLLIASGALGCGVGAASGQTTDPIFRSWRGIDGATTPRALGLGGAIVGLADDGAAADGNPAGLATIPRAGELQLGWRFRSQEGLGSGDRVKNLPTFTSPTTLVVRLGSRVGLGYQWVALRPASTIAFDDGRQVGSLTTSVSGPGVSLGVRVSPFVNVGLSVNAVRAHIDEGEYLRSTEAGASDLRVRFGSSGDTRITGTVGVLVKARELSYGLAFRLGSSWSGVRTASNPSTGRVIDEGTPFDVRSPSVLSGGVAWQPVKVRRAGTFLLTGEVDYVRSGEIKATAVPGVPFKGSDYAVEDAWELRGGGEVTFPLLTTWAARGGPWRPNRLQLRAGIYRQAAGSLAYGGPDPVERSLFPPSGYRRLWSIGASIGGTTIWRVAGAVRWGGEYRQVVAGIAIRYPGLFP